MLIFHYIATTNIGGDIPIDVPTNQNIGGDTSPASPAGLTPMAACVKYKVIPSMQGQGLTGDN